MKDTNTQKLAWVGAAITCPCHIFILAILLAGTAAGAFITSYFIPLVVIFSILFALSIWEAIKTK